MTEVMEVQKYSTKYPEDEREKKEHGQNTRKTKENERMGTVVS